MKVDLSHKALSHPSLLVFRLQPRLKLKGNLAIRLGVSLFNRMRLKTLLWLLLEEDRNVREKRQR